MGTGEKGRGTLIRAVRARKREAAARRTTSRPRETRRRGRAAPAAIGRVVAIECGDYAARWILATASAIWAVSPSDPSRRFWVSQTPSTPQARSVTGRASASGDGGIDTGRPAAWARAAHLRRSPRTAFIR